MLNCLSSFPRPMVILALMSFAAVFLFLSSAVDGFHIRKMKAGDITDVKRIQWTCLKESFKEETYRESLHEHCYVAVEGEDSIIGYVLTKKEAGFVDGYYCDIVSLGVLPDKRRQGVGRALMKKVEEAYKGGGDWEEELNYRIYDVTFASVYIPVRNIGAQTFFTKIGYQKHRRVDRYMSEDAFEFRKDFKKGATKGGSFMQHFFKKGKTNVESSA